MSASTRAARKPFVVDLPAHLLKRNPELSKHARQLYSTMRGLSEGKSGALRIRGRWLKAKAIDAAAEMGRDVRMKAMRELVALGLVAMPRERVVRVIRGRRREVLGPVHYFVHRQPMSRKRPQPRPFLLQSISSTVEEIDSQVLSNPPSAAGVGVSSLASPGFVQETGRDRSHHHQAEPKGDDDPRAALPESNPNPFLTDEDADTVRRVRQNLAADHRQLVEALRLDTVSDEWFVVAMNHIEERGEGKISSPVAYFTKSLANFLADVASGVESARTLLDGINAAVDEKQALREKYGITRVAPVGRGGL